LPKEYDTEFMVWQLCGGDASMRDVYLGWTFEDAFLWLMLKRYDNYIDRMQWKPKIKDHIDE